MGNTSNGTLKNINKMNHKELVSIVIDHSYNIGEYKNMIKEYNMMNYCDNFFNTHQNEFNDMLWVYDTINYLEKTIKNVNNMTEVEIKDFIKSSLEKNIFIDLLHYINSIKESYNKNGGHKCLQCIHKKRFQLDNPIGNVNDVGGYYD